MNGAGLDGLIGRLQAAADRMAAAAGDAPGATPLATPDWLAEAAREGSLRRPIAWRNTVVRLPAWRRLHVEFFAIPGEIGVVHLCGFPDPAHALPILGFDIIAGRERATGCFLDLSPTVAAATRATDAWARDLAPLRGTLGQARPLPDWAAAIFSPHAVAVRPRSAAEVAAGLALGEATLARMLHAPPPPATDAGPMRDAQARYVAAQRRNERTRRMLAGCVGETLADRFIAECLFPEPPLPDRSAAPRAALPALVP